MRIVLACDHGGFELKEQIKKWLCDRGEQIVDVGLREFDETSDFPIFAKLGVGEILAHGGIGIFICGTGIGISIAANRYRGIRAALCHSVEYAKMSRLHNDANVLCLGGRYLNFEQAKEIIETFLKTEFLGGKYQKRIDLLD